MPSLNDEFSFLVCCFYDPDKQFKGIELSLGTGLAKKA